MTMTMIFDQPEADDGPGLYTDAADASAKQALRRCGTRSQPGVNRALLASVLTLTKQVNELTRQMKAMPTLGYRGTWSKDMSYSVGDFATHSGSVFHCNANTTTRPGNGSDWTLAVKRGRDGR